MSYQLKQLFSADEIRQAIGEKLSGMELFFASPIMLDIFFNNPYFELWYFNGEGVTTLIVKKLRTKEVRILYKTLGSDAIEFLKDFFHPPFIAYNLLFQDPHQENQVVDEELIISVDTLLSFSDHRIKHKYDQAIEKNSHIVLKPYQPTDAHALKDFFSVWEQEKSSQNEKFKSGIYHDELFIDRYGFVSEVFGVCAFDQDKVIGYSIGINNIVTIGPYGKCLRGYHQLGLQLFIERAKQAAHFGYKELNIASINNDFKKQFLPFGRKLPVYGYEVFRTELFQTKTPNDYTRMLFSQ